MAETKLEETYQVDEDDVRLSVKAGEGQTGTIRVEIDGDTKVSAVHEVKDHKCGKGSELDGSQIVVRTRVRKANNQSDRASVTYTLEGGAKDESWISREEFDDPDEALRFRGIFDLTTQDG